MSKITKENVLLIQNAKLLAIARRDEKTRKLTIYAVEEVSMENLEKLFNHLTGENESQNDRVQLHARQVEENNHANS